MNSYFHHSMCTFGSIQFDKQLFFSGLSALSCKYPLIGGRQILPHSISPPPTHFNVLMIPSVAIVNANKEIMFPATMAISRGFPAAVNSTVEKLLTRCSMILGTVRKESAAHTGLMNQRHSEIQKYITFMFASKAFIIKRDLWVQQQKDIINVTIS